MSGSAEVVNAMFATARILSDNGTVAVEEAQENDFQAATTVAQIFSGIVFMGLGIWMLISNGTKFSYIQRASLEKRLGTCCAIDTYVALFSAFFNFFQLTEVDDLFLPRPGGFTLDFSRPVEWIVTCPMMQVVLVLMGGSRIPEYRRVLMPALSLLSLGCATTSMLTGSPTRFIFYAIGACIATVMFSLNAKQIQEHSNDQENIWVGDSEFRKASVLLIVTWVPFPMWFLLSPEGIGIIDNILVIQMGWAFLNILSKFTFIFYIQRVKDNYCNRLKVKREMVGVNNNTGSDSGMGALTNMLGISPTNPLKSENATKENELAAVVIETMNFLGMAQHNDRFLKLLHDAGVKSVARVEELTKEESDKLALPWDLVTALQKRIKVWRMEMTDNAELELERGEAHYLASTPREPVDLPGAVGDDSVSQVGGAAGPEQLRAALFKAMAGGSGASVSGEFEQRMEAQMQQMQQLMGMMQDQAEQINAAAMRRSSEVEASMSWKLDQLLDRAGQQSGNERLEQMINQVAERSDNAVESLARNMMAKMDSVRAQQVREQTENEEKFMQRMNSMVQKATDSAADSLSSAITAKMDTEKTIQIRQHSDLEDSILNKLEGMLRKSGGGMVSMGGKSGDDSSNMQTIIAKMDATQNASRSTMEKMERIESMIATGGPGGISSSVAATSSGGIAEGVMLQTLQNKIESMLNQAAQRHEMESSILGNAATQMSTQLDGSRTPVRDGSRTPTSMVDQSMAQPSNDLERALQSRLENLQAAQMRQIEDSIRRKVEDAFEQVIVRVEHSVHSVHGMMQADLGVANRGNSIVADTVKATTEQTKENLADLRRISLLVLEQSSAALEKSQGTLGKMDVLQGSLDTGFGRVIDRVQELSVLTLGGSGRSTPGGSQWPTQDAGHYGGSNGGGSGSGSRRPSMSGGAGDMRQMSKYSMSNING